MYKNILLISLVSLCILMQGCGNQKTNQSQSQSANSSQTSSENSITPPDSTNSLTKMVNYPNLNGEWKMGKQGWLGASALMTIKNTSNSQFEFCINAEFVINFIDKNGQKVLNPHMGAIDGIAYFVSLNEAYYTLKDYSDYKMIFKISDSNKITIEEVSTKDGFDYGMSPLAGVNVRYCGDYTLSKSQKTKTIGNSQTVNTNSNGFRENLCADNEEILFSFKIANSPKTLSICLSDNQPDYIVYRFGTKEKIELEFPENKGTSWQQFNYSYFLSDGKKENAGKDNNYLSFESGGCEYKIYQEYTTKDSIPKVGIRIKDKASSKETEIMGLSNSIEGSLDILKRNLDIATNDNQ